MTWLALKRKKEYIPEKSLLDCALLQTFDFSILYTTIPHSQLKDRLKKLIHQSFVKRCCTLLENTPFVLINSVKVILSKCWIFLLTTILYNLACEITKRNWQDRYFFFLFAISVMFCHWLSQHIVNISKNISQRTRS